MQTTFHGIIEPFERQDGGKPLPGVPVEEPLFPPPPTPVEVDDACTTYAEDDFSPPPVLPAGPCIAEAASVNELALPFCIGAFSAVLLYYAFSSGKVKD